MYSNGRRESGHSRRIGNSSWNVRSDPLNALGRTPVDSKRRANLEETPLANPSSGGKCLPNRMGERNHSLAGVRLSFSHKTNSRDLTLRPLGRWGRDMRTART